MRAEGRCEVDRRAGRASHGLDGLGHVDGRVVGGREQDRHHDGVGAESTGGLGRAVHTAYLDHHAPRATTVSACLRCEGATPRLPGTTMTSGSFPLRLRWSEAGRNSLPSIASFGSSAELLMTWK